MNTVALKAAPASRFARFWQIVRREASRAVALHVESCGMMAEVYRRSGR
jgi:post-segregation antitoxin (ccd killing protein)